MTIVFRVNCGKGVGYGHLFRCMSLAKALTDSGNIEVLFVSNEEAAQHLTSNNITFVIRECFDDTDLLRSLNPDLVVVDSYEVGTDYLEEIGHFSRLLIFDYENLFESVRADFVVNGNIYADYVSHGYEDSLTLFGPSYLILKPEYWKEEVSKISYGEGILITTGGEDKFRIMPLIAEALLGLSVDKRFVIGPGFDTEETDILSQLLRNDPLSRMAYHPRTLANLIDESSVIITAAGSTIYEVLAKKRLPITFCMANNQLRLAEALHRYGVMSLGWYSCILPHEFLKATESALNNRQLYSHRLKDLFEKVDGKGALRVAAKILEVLKK